MLRCVFSDVCMRKASRVCMRKAREAETHLAGPGCLPFSTRCVEFVNMYGAFLVGEFF
jgi:hypothetical protein